MIKEHIDLVKKKSIDIVEFTHRFLEKSKRINSDFNFLNTISEDLAIQQAKALKKNPKGKLAGIPMTVKDCICVKGVESTAGSQILKGYYRHLYQPRSIGVHIV